MKKFYKVLLIAVIIAAVVTGFSVKSFAARNIYDTKALSSKLSDILQDWIIKNEAQYYKNIDVVITPVKVEVKEGKVEETFNVTVSEILKATSPEELSAIRGMEKFKSLKKEELSSNQINAVNKEINSWVTELKGYIGKTETLNAGFKVVADLSQNKSILPETVNFFMEDAQGGFYKVDSLISTADEMEAEGLKHAKEIADKAKDAVPNNFVVDTYQRTDAANYADTYTSNPPDGEGNDQYEYLGNGEYSWWDTTHWNNNVYQLSTSFSSDCADYVSQAMYKGGIPMDSIHDVNHWWYDNSESVSSYDYCPWVYVPALKEYMINSGHWEPSSYYWANAGSVIVNQANTHVMMVTQNDTIHRALSAHMTDRKHFRYSLSNGDPILPYYANCEYYTVHNYVSCSSYLH